MKNYILEEKNSFIILGFGTELKSHYTDFSGLNKEKFEFWQAITKDGRLNTLKALASNNYIFSVNETVNNRMMHYAGVLSEKTDAKVDRVIQFPKSNYLIVKGEGKTPEELNNILSGIAFGQVLRSETEFAYVGGPNTTVITDQKDDLVIGEIWIPVIKK